ncbi:hypothetical protein BDV35DRAFT_284026 [Aspergillus flavus]|uniref:Uncharacterized protein n=1 Tax=Aspergillus flavus TaxID=5059 RepID=A0A5N6GQR6_ASPFL|nr:hypothetical protein BDV35DRAFT_284026 [Aspergillus flavus]
MICGGRFLTLFREEPKVLKIRYHQILQVVEHCTMFILIVRHGRKQLKTNKECGLHCRHQVGKQPWGTIPNNYSCLISLPEAPHDHPVTPRLCCGCCVLRRRSPGARTESPSQTKLSFFPPFSTPHCIVHDSSATPFPLSHILSPPVLTEYR